MTHTPTPWNADGPDWAGDYNILPDLSDECLAIGAVVSNMRHPDITKANAAFIVTAVNSHDALLDALESIDRLFRAQRAAGGEEAEKVGWYFKDACPLRVKVDVAIKTATKEPSK